MAVGDGCAQSRQFMSALKVYSGPAGVHYGFVLLTGKYDVHQTCTGGSYLTLSIDALIPSHQ